MIKPYFKWPGSKTWLINRLADFLPRDFKRIIEPFAGSAAFFLGGECEKALLGDTNEHIAFCLSAVRDNPREVLIHLSSLKNTIDDFKRVKKFQPSNAIQAAARIIFLTNTSWGGLYRENRQGDFNVPFGNNGRDFYCPEKIRIASEKLQGAEIIHGNFDLTIEKSTANDLIFIDAPYVTRTFSQHFDRYHASRFGWDEQVKLSNMLKERKMRNRKILITCAANSELYELFRGWSVIEFSKRNSMTAYKTNSGNRTEALLFSPALSYMATDLESREMGNIKLY
ncbi:DNA adenine methylase [Janthinobacterium sp. NFX145]|uniref:DNA adenine methylase n=1 Tax=Janthinobacterium sp. NFX145 TaxID=3415602 RepID=UPI003CC5BCED